MLCFNFAYNIQSMNVSKSSLYIRSSKDIFPENIKQEVS